MSIDTLIDDEQFKVLLQYIYAQIRISCSNEIKSFIQTNPFNISRDGFKPSDAMQLLDCLFWHLNAMKGLNFIPEMLVLKHFYINILMIN